MAEASNDSNGVNGAHERVASTSGHQRTYTDSDDAQAMVIASLRSQVQDLFTQVTQLNGKLVKSYDRVSDLEDDLHMASSNLRNSSLKISQLELERTQHLSALNTGLLVEKSNVTAELTRLMEKATEEAAQRGQAESARADIEKDLDDLSASLFGQANTMVAEARFAQALSERKVEEAELALRSAEEAVGLMQQQMQMLQAEKETAERHAQDMKIIMGKGKWVDRSPTENADIVKSLRLLSTHVPYQEFLLCVAHLRSIHPSSPSPPSMSTLLSLPFLARLLTEDSEPTVRLDLAPSLNWLSRRSVLSAIHNGQLTIEPMASTALLYESASYGANSSPVAGLHSTGTNISCALCGTPIFSTPETQSAHSKPPTHPLSALAMSRSNTSNQSNSTIWSSFKNPLSNISSSPPRSLTSSPQPPSQLYPPQVYIFRLASTTNTVTVSSIPPSTPLPITSSAFASSYASSPQPSSSSSSHQRYQTAPTPQPPLRSVSNSTTPSTIYPLCASGWCLNRLRTTCSLWAFVRTGVVEKIWEEEVPSLLLPAPPSLPPKARSRERSGTVSIQASLSQGAAGDKPPIPPRRRGLWGMASALTERAASWTADSDKDKDKGKMQPVPEKETEKKTERKLPPPPPHHPRLPSTDLTNAKPTPPPLPKRSEVRGKNVRADSVPKNSASETDGTAELPAPPQPEAPSNNSSASTTGSPEIPNDSFSTPPEEISNPHSPPQAQVPNPNPASIPLPDSRPPTPATHVTKLPVHDDAPKVIAPESDSPTPSRTASPAPPPPLPRRAAARKSRSMSIVGGGPVRSRPVTPNPVPLIEEEPSDSDKPAEVASQAEASVPTQDKSEESDSLAIETVTTSPTATPPSLPVEGEEKAPSDGPATNGVVAKENGDSPQVLKTEEKVQINGDAVKVEDEKAVVLNGAGTKRSSNNGNSAHEEKEEKEEQGPQDVYIGDATWEERTWKELVKLREDMFWARIGGLRQ